MVPNKGTSLNNLNNYLNKISQWDFQWKMDLNPDPNKEVQEVILTHKLSRIVHKSYFLTTALYKKTAYQKHLGMRLYIKFSRTLNSTT